MIITCEECSTRFNLDESMIKAEGSKVRCSLCKHIFTAFPQVPDPPMAPEAEEDFSFDFPEETLPNDLEPDDLELDTLEPDELEPEEFKSDDTELDFEETRFDMDDLDFDMDETRLEKDGKGLEMETPEKESSDIEINFDPESYNFEADADIEYDEAELTFDEADIEFSDSDPTVIPPGDPEEVEDFDDYDYNSLDQDSLILEENDTPEITEDALEADLSFDDDPDVDLVFEETGPEQDLALELKSSDEQDMTFPDLAMETQDPEIAPDQEDLSLALDPDPFGPLDHGLEDSDLEEKPDLFDSKTRFEEDSPEPGDAFSAYDQVLDQDTEPEETFQGIDDMTDDEPTDQTLMESRLEEIKPAQETGLAHPELDPGRPRKRKKKSGMGGPVMLFLLLFILVAGAYIASMTLGYKIPYLSDVKIPILEQYFKKEMPPKAALKPIPNEGSVNGRFISNDTAGELFIITGKIENPAAIPYSHIQIKGTLITKGKVKAKTQTAFCGNIISEEILKTGNIMDITQQLATREGSHNSNVNVKPGGFVPFMIVFSDLPDNLENFTVEVVER